MKIIENAHKIGTVAAAALQRLLTALLPAAQAFQEYLDRPEVQARIHNALLVLQEMHDRVEAIDAPGYTPYFEGLGHTGISARLYAGIIRYRAKLLYQESQDKRVALMALHRLAKRSRWHPALDLQVARLRDHCCQANFLDEAFRAAGCPACKSEFLDLLQGTRDGDYSQGPRLMDIIALIAPYAPSARGRPMSFESALHQTLLRLGGHLGGRHGYTYGLVRDSPDGVEDFVDEATAATRIELGRPSFNPIAARRAVKSRLARDIGAKPNEE